MSARINPAITNPVEVIGSLLYTGYQLTDDLQVDLYGHEADQDSGIEVTGVTLTGQRTDITALFSVHCLHSMSTWIQFKDDTNPVLREHALRARYDAARLPI